MGRIYRYTSEIDTALDVKVMRSRACFLFAAGYCFFLLVIGGSGVSYAQSENELATMVGPARMTWLPESSEARSAETSAQRLKSARAPDRLLTLRGQFSPTLLEKDVDQMERLLQAGVELRNWEDVGDDGLVAHCVREGAVEMAALLLQYGADVQRCGREGATPLQMAIATRDALMVRVLLEAGADPNKQFVRPVSDGFLAITEKDTMQWFLKHERRLTPLMMAANNGDVAIIKSLLDHGAKKYIHSGRYRLYPLNFASRRSDVKAMQVMLGKDPEKEPFYVILDLSDQRLRLYNAQKNVVFSSRVSTGKAGYRTPTGEYVITDKHRSHRSTIYHVKMPYFQRLSCSSIGFHSGYVPGYPASHGCIRMPYQSAKELFRTTPAGTRVVIQD